MAYSLATKTTKRSAIILTLILIILCFVLYITFGPVGWLTHRAEQHQQQQQQWDQSKDLLLIHVVFRHGARTPADTYPHDPFINETFSPYGWGQITNNGKRELYQMGQWLRQRYGAFVGREYAPELLWAQTTDVPRTKVSMSVVLAGLFPPVGTTMEWNRKLNWQPIPAESQPLNEDSLLLVRLECPRYHEALNEVFQSTEMENILNENQELFSELTAATGLTIKTPDDIQSLYSTFRAETEFGLKLPEWTNNYYPNRLINLTELSYIFNVYTPELQKLKGGPFIKKMIDEQEERQLGTLQSAKRKLFLYTGHDSTVVNILASLNVWERQMPTYGIMAMFELVRDKATQEIGVQIYLRNSTTSGAIPLTIPGCEHFCPFERFLEATRNVASVNLIEDCKAKDPNFVGPTEQGGP